MNDADLGEAVEASVAAGFSNAGQWCTSTSRVLLHRAIANQFLEMLTSRCERMVVGDGLQETTDMGPVAGPQQYHDICDAVRQAQEDGARIVAGSGDLSDRTPDGYFIRPTVFVDVKPEMPLFQEEIFGPVLAVSEFDSLGEALELANDSMYGLSSAIFTRDLGSARSYIDGIEAGLAHVNIHTGYKEPSMPFGGIKLSGAGLPENSQSGLEFFVDRKAVYLR
jgi:aldehyde dehydrogenase (NAD+)